VQIGSAPTSPDILATTYRHTTRLTTRPISRTFSSVRTSESFSLWLSVNDFLGRVTNYEVVDNGVFFVHSSSMTRRYALRDDQWKRIEPLLPGREGHVGVTARDTVLYRYRAGIAWRDLPERFGDFRVVHTRFSRWSRSGVWQRLFQMLSEDADNEYSMIDSTIVRAHQHSAGAQKKSKPSGAAVAG